VAAANREWPLEERNQQEARQEVAKKANALMEARQVQNRTHLQQEEDILSAPRQSAGSGKELPPGPLLGAAATRST
jgi:hypothetical protein